MAFDLGILCNHFRLQRQLDFHWWYMNHTILKFMITQLPQILKDHKIIFEFMHIFLWGFQIVSQIHIMMYENEGANFVKVYFTTKIWV